MIQALNRHAQMSCNPKKTPSQRRFLLRLEIQKQAFFAQGLANKLRDLRPQFLPQRGTSTMPISITAQAVYGFEDYSFIIKIVNNNYEIVNMSDQSSAYSQSDREHNQRLSSIWKSIRETKNISKPLKPSDKHKYYLHDSRATKNNPSLYVSSYLNKPQQRHHSPDSNALLLQKLQLAEEENLRLQNQLQIIQRQAEQKLQSLRKDYQKRLRVTLKREAHQQKQNLYQVNDNRESNNKTDKLIKQIDRMTLKIKSLQLQNRNGQNEIIKLTEANQRLAADLQSEQRFSNSHALMNQGKGSQLLQLAQANNTIQRLLELLKKTDQYKSFSAMITESKEMHYLKNVLKRLKSNQLTLTKNNKKSCSCSNSVHARQENILWSPVECYKIMLAMKLKYDYLNEDCIEEVLFQLNKIYSSKEERHVGRVKSFYEGQMVRLKRKMEQGYDEMTSKKQISRLKREIKVFKSGQKVKPQLKMEGLRNKGQYEDELKLKNKQIKLLQERIRLFETQNGYYDKSLYYQGAIWIIDKILAQLESNETTLKQFQIGFRERIQQNVQPQDWLRSYKQFFQRITELGTQMVERVLTIKESMLKKMGNQKL